MVKIKDIAKAANVSVSCQHVIVAYGNYVEALKDFCKMMDIEFIY